MIDLLASRPNYLAHLQPVWDALPDELRGTASTPASSPPLEGAGAALVASHADVVRATRAGYRAIALLEHGIGQTYDNHHPAYPGGRGRDDVGLFLSPNETAAAADRARYPRARVEVVGDPVLDRLPRGKGGRQMVAVSFHWGSPLSPELRSTIGYWRPALAGLAREVDLIGHAHPRVADRMRRIYRAAGIEFVATFDEVCERAALYVADNTSTLYEFASTGRPVVLLNAPWYRRDRELGLRFWAAAGVGLQADTPGELADVIAAALGDPPAQRDAREDALGIAYAYRSGAGARAAAAIADWVGEVGAIAA